MNPEEIQGPMSTAPELTPDEAAASLSFATMLSEQLMPKEMPMEGEMTEGEPTEEAPEVPQPEVDIEALVAEKVDEVVGAKIAELEERLSGALTPEEPEEEEKEEKAEE